MKKLFLIACLLFASSTAWATTYFTEDFNGFFQNYTCNNSTSCTPMPGNYDDWNGDSSTSTSPDTVISTDFERSTPGENNRGMRIYVWADTAGYCCENGPAENNPGFPVNFYLRWYMRMSRAGGGPQYAKIHRMFGNNMIFDWYRAYDTGYKTRLCLFDSSDGWNAKNPNMNYALEDDYTPNTWVCYEVFVNQTANQWTLWVDGVNKGTTAISSNPTNWSSGSYQIGGNQTGGYSYTIDYDDIVVADEYIGPAGTSLTTCYLDADGDGYSDGTTEQVEGGCSTDYYIAGDLTATTGDCDDSNAAINPGADDLTCDGVDQDCSGADNCETPECDAAHLELCTDQSTCETAGLYWCEGECTIAPCQPTSPVIVDIGSLGYGKPVSFASLGTGANTITVLTPIVGTTNYLEDANIIAAYLMTGSTTEPDASGNGNTLSVYTPNSIPTTLDVPAGYSGTSRDFENSDNETLYQTDGGDLDISGNQDFSIVAWMKLENQISGAIFTKYYATGDQRQIQFGYRSADDALVGYVSSDGTLGNSSKAVGATKTIDDLNWHHVAMVFDYDAGGSTITLYVDGSEDTNSTDNPKSHTGGIYNSAAIACVGAACGTAAIISGSTFDGVLNEVAIFDRVLSAGEVLDIMTYGLNGEKGVTE